MTHPKKRSPYIFALFYCVRPRDGIDRSTERQSRAVVDSFVCDALAGGVVHDIQSHFCR
jgi:hypothetical protein